MRGVEFESCGRSMRWYEWLAALLMLGLFAGARADVVYKCTDAAGHLAYQAQECASAQHASLIDIAPAPAYAPSPHYAIETPSTSREREARSPHRESTAETAYECHASDGRVFYRLSACPHSLAGAASSASNSHGGKRGGSRASAGVSVSARRVTREEACRQIHRAGAIGRDGHEFDEHISTYERDLGHDPCKS